MSLFFFAVLIGSCRFLMKTYIEVHANEKFMFQNVKKGAFIFVCIDGDDLNKITKKIATGNNQNHVISIFLSQHQGSPKPIAVEPCSGNKAAVLTVFLCLPRGSSGVPPPGQSGKNLRNSGCIALIQLFFSTYELIFT